MVLNSFQVWLRTLTRHIWRQPNKKNEKAKENLTDNRVMICSNFLIFY